MGGTPDHSRTRIKPYLITKDAEGQVRLTVRDTRYNGQGYPVVVSQLVEEPFESATAARAHAKAHFGAVAGEFATK
jgi:hypothetical protein